MDFLQSNGIYPYEEEVIYILRRLDKDDDGRISLLELQNETCPKESLGFLAGSHRTEKPGAVSYDNPVGKLAMGSASKSYPYEPVRRSASPMKSQILKSPLKEKAPSAFVGARVSSHRKEYSQHEGNARREHNQIDSSSVNREYREYISSNKEFSSNKEREAIYESPKKRLEFESVTSGSKNVKYASNNVNTQSPVYKRPENSIRDLKGEIEEEMKYSKRNMEIKEMKSELEREMLQNKARSPPKSSLLEKLEKRAYSSNKTPEKPLVDSLSYQSLPKKPAITEAVLFEIAQFMKLVIRAEREVQYLRGDLSLRPDYNATELFNAFDRLMKGYLNPEEIEEFFQAFDVFSSQEKSAFLQRFCKTKEIFKYSLFIRKPHPRPPKASWTS